ncbi:MAG: hypothetical protein U1F13_03905 [Acinetobacter parvus]
MLEKTKLFDVYGKYSLTKSSLHFHDTELFRLEIRLLYPSAVGTIFEFLHVYRVPRGQLKSHGPAHGKNETIGQRISKVEVDAGVIVVLLTVCWSPEKIELTFSKDKLDSMSGKK